MTPPTEVQSCDRNKHRIHDHHICDMHDLDIHLTEKSRNRPLFIFSTMPACARCCCASEEASRLSVPAKGLCHLASFRTAVAGQSQLARGKTDFLGSPQTPVAAFADVDTGEPWVLERGIVCSTLPSQIATFLRCHEEMFYCRERRVSP